jgi:hypothetical protein
VYAYRGAINGKLESEAALIAIEKRRNANQKREHTDALSQPIRGQGRSLSGNTKTNDASSYETSFLKSRFS